MVKEHTLKNLLAGAKSWQDIHSKLVKYNEPSDPRAGKLFEYFCKHYFLCEPSVRREFKNIWLDTEVPLKIRRKLTMAKLDYGLDLVLEHQDGRLFAVQCKFKTNESASLSWTKDRLSSWLSESDEAKGLILFTNAAKIDAHTQTKAKKKDFWLYTGGDLRGLDNQIIAQIRKSVAGQRPKKPIQFTPKPYQRKAINDIVKKFRKHNRGQLILPCGAGKTLIALWTKERLNAKRTLVVVPSLALLRQIHSEWATHQKSFIPYLCVCSDKTVDQEKREDKVVVQRYEVHGRVTTKAADVRTFLRKNPTAIIYSTYQSLDVVQQALKGTKLQFDLTLCDEAHKTAGDKKGKFARVHKQAFPTKRRLYMTATPKVTSDKIKNRLGEETFKLLADMSDEETFGPVFHEMSFAEAISSKILTDYKIIVIGVSDAELKRAVDTRRWTKDTTIDEVANNYALHKVMGKYKAHHSITFHSSVRRAKNFGARHADYYDKVHTEHVNGTMSTNDRAILLDEFKAEDTAVLTNARCLTEGIDVPTIDCVYFCDPKSSKIDIVQASGRALRLPKGAAKKDFGYIVVPIFHKNRKNVESAVDKSAFKHVVDVVRALADQDERLQAEIHQLITNKGKRSLQGQRINIDLGKERLILTGFESVLKRSLFDQLIERTTTRWDQRIFELLAYKTKFHTLRVPKDAKIPWTELGEWVDGVRADKRNDHLSEERIMQLDALGFDWKVDGETLTSTKGLLNEKEFIKASGLTAFAKYRKRGLIKPVGYALTAAGLSAFYRPSQIKELKKKLGITLTSTKGLLNENEFIKASGVTTIASCRKRGLIKPVGYALTSTGLGPFYRPSQIKALKKKLGITLDNTKGLLNEVEFRNMSGLSIIGRYRKRGLIKPVGYALTNAGLSAFYRPSQIKELKKKLGKV